MRKFTDAEKMEVLFRTLESRKNNNKLGILPGDIISKIKHSGVTFENSVYPIDSFYEDIQVPNSIMENLYKIKNNKLYLNDDFIKDELTEKWLNELENKYDIFKVYIDSREDFKNLPKYIKCKLIINTTFIVSNNQVECKIPYSSMCLCLPGFIEFVEEYTNNTLKPDTITNPEEQELIVQQKSLEYSTIINDYISNYGRDNLCELIHMAFDKLYINGNLMGEFYDAWKISRIIIESQQEYDIPQYIIIDYTLNDIQYSNEIFERVYPNIFKIRYDYIESLIEMDLKQKNNIKKHKENMQKLFNKLKDGKQYLYVYIVSLEVTYESSVPFTEMSKEFVECLNLGIVGIEFEDDLPFIILKKEFIE